jgi:hypothetical protein
MEALDEGERALRRAHWPLLDGPWSSEKFATTEGLTSPLVQRACEHFALLDRRVKLRLLVAVGCLRASEAASLGEDVAALVRTAQGDGDSWVRVIARVIGEQRGCVAEGASMLPEEAALVEKLAARAAEPGVSGLLRPEEDAFLGACAPVAASQPHFSVATSGEAREQQRLAAAKACRLPKVAWEKVPAAGGSAAGAASDTAPRKRGRDSGEPGDMSKAQKARQVYQDAKRRRQDGKGRERGNAIGSLEETMTRKDDQSFKEMEQKKALAEQEKIRKKEEERAARQKKMEEREAARKEEVRKRRGGVATAAAHGLRGTEAALPAWLLDKDLDPRDGDALDPQGFVYKCKYPQLGDMAYYMDRKKRYPFYTEEGIGGVGLVNLMSRNEVLLGKNMERLKALAQGDELKVVDLLAGGKHIYDTKPTLSATRGTDHLATWSQEEYGQPGLQREYLIYKSLQRYTETWALFERAAVAGLFVPEFLRNKKAEGDDESDDDDDDDDAKEGDEESSSSDEDEDEVQPVRVASVGGGPGYELFAAREFFARYAGSVPVQLCSLDLEQSWDEYVDLLLPPTCALSSMRSNGGSGSRFAQWDVNIGSVFDQIGGGGLDYVIISYVLEMYMTTDYCCDMMAGWLKEKGVRAIIISSRSPTLDAKAMMEKRGIAAKHLLAQPGGGGRDERQTLFVLPSTLQEMADSSGGGKKGGGGPDWMPPQFVEDGEMLEKRWKAIPSMRGSSSVFPNVPFEDNKQTDDNEEEEEVEEAAAAAAADDDGNRDDNDDDGDGGGSVGGIKQEKEDASGGSGAGEGSAASPTYAPQSPTYQPGADSPTYLPGSPGANSPTYAPGSPGANSPTYVPGSPGANSPTYVPGSPGGSPSYAPGSPDAIQGSGSEDEEEVMPQSPP